MKYDSYKDSNIPWIGQIPSHWGQCRLKSYNSLKGRIGWNGLRSDEFLTEGYAYLVTGQDFSGKDIQWDKCYQIEKPRYDEDPFIQLKNGDLLITKDGTIGKIATVNNLDKPACLNSGIFVMKQTKDMFEQGYLFWLLTSDLLKEFNNYTSSGTTILHLYQNVFENMPMIVPTKVEQKAISDYLDKKCADIDKAIVTQQKRINLLKELRQNVINKLLTKGIDISCTLKETKISSVGNIPSHWGIRKIKWVLKKGKDGIKIGPFGSSLTGKVDSSYDYKVYGQWNIISSNFSAGQSYVSEETFKELQNYEVKPSDILISMMGTVGKCSVVPDNIEQGIMDSHVVKIRLDERIYNSQFFEFVYDKDNSQIVRSQIDKVKKGSIMDGLNSSLIKELFVPVPPIQEQIAIVHEIKKQIEPIDIKIQSSQSKIDLLLKYQKSLIYEAVTGKFKV